ncbi:hypothetical protein CLAIMM_10425 isoform 1 [Cladophialophora immunda]|nr:hypothetical protein CLAIMM_10425 isoform 1 [Cladophialophora immunda]
MNGKEQTGIGSVDRGATRKSDSSLFFGSAHRTERSRQGRTRDMSESDDSREQPQRARRISETLTSTCSFDLPTKDLEGWSFSEHVCSNCYAAEQRLQLPMSWGYQTLGR